MVYSFHLFILSVEEQENIFYCLEYSVLSVTFVIISQNVP